MERFEIEDIISQDTQGVVFRAIDKESGNAVAIRRFFPFGQNNGGLDKDESIAFVSASKRLSEVEHPSLRSVIVGGTDPIDHIPYLATQWVDGVSLRTIIASESLEPGLVIDILRLTLEVSTVLSHVLGEEGVWVETSVGSIVVGTKESGRGFTFWISPFKWLGTDTSAKSLLSIVELGEELTGWKGKLISDQAGHGLGGWLKCIRKNPDISLHEALELLANSTGNEPPQPEEQIVQQAARPLVKPRRPFSKATLLTTAVLALCIASAALFYLHKTTKLPLVAAEYAEQEISEVIIEITPPARDKPTAAKQSRTDKVNALAIKMRQEVAGKTSKTEAEITEREKMRKKRGDVYLPGDTILMKNLKSGTPVKLRGTLAKAGFSTTGKSLYLYFSDPYEQGQIRGVLRKKSFRGDCSPEAFKSLIGKEITLDGKSLNENTKNPRLVKITEMGQISQKK